MLLIIIKLFVSLTCYNLTVIKKYFLYHAYRNDEKNARERPDGERWTPVWSSPFNSWWMRHIYRVTKSWTMFSRMTCWTKSINCLCHTWDLLLSGTIKRLKNQSLRPIRYKIGDRLTSKDRNNHENFIKGAAKDCYF